MALLRRGARKQWLSAAWTAGGITLLFLVFLDVATSRDKGHTLFELLFLLACTGVVGRGFALTTDLFSEERRNGTLGLLVLTGLDPLEIFTHKLLGALLLTAFALLGGLPFFAIPFLTGGVTSIQFVCALLFLANGLLFCVAIGLLSSVLHREGGQAQITAVAITGFLSLAMPAAHWIIGLPSGMGGLATGWLALSPAYAPYLVATGFRGGTLPIFWTTSAITLVYSLLALLLAAAILQRTWREGPAELLPARWRERWRGEARGSEAWRRQLRDRVLDHQPFCWLAARNRGPVLAAEVFTACIPALWVGWALSGLPWLNLGNIFLTCIILHSGLICILAYAAAQTIGAERLSGSLETLLTTPLSSHEIVRGQQQALLVQFKGVLTATQVADALLFATGLALVPWSASSVFIYLLAWVFLAMIWHYARTETALKAMWISAWTGRPAYAAQQAVWPFLWPALCLSLLARGLTHGLGQIPGLLGTLLVLFFVFLLVAAFRSHSFLTPSKGRSFLLLKLIAELRDIARAPIPARGDKRFQRWDPYLIHPPGRWGELDLELALRRANAHRRAKAILERERSAKPRYHAEQKRFYH